MLNGVTGAAAPVNVEEEQEKNTGTALRPKMEAVHAPVPLKEAKAATTRPARVGGQILDKPLAVSSVLVLLNTVVGVNARKVW